MPTTPTPENGAAPQDGQFQLDGVLTVSGGHAVHDTYTAFLAPLLPEFVGKLALSTTQAGLLSVFMQVPSLLQPLIGHLADRSSLRMLVVIAPTVTAVAMSLLGIAPGYAALALLLVTAGASSASMHAVGPVMIGSLSGANLGRGMGIWMVGGELGRTMGPVVIASAVQFLGLGSMPWLMIGGLLTSAILYTRLRSAPERPLNGPGGLPWRDGLRSMAPILLPLSGIIITRSFMSNALTTYLPLFLSQEGADLWLAGASLSILEAAGVVGALAGGSVSDRIGRRRMLFGSMLVTPLLMFIFLATGNALRLPLLLALGLTSLSITPVIMAMVQESFPESRALANGVYMALSFVLRAGVTLVIGAIGDLLDLRLAFAVSAVAPLLGLPLIALLTRRPNDGPSS
jgi:FSR family fosmidomycin resistance protein-like MFS transporter